jgi:hypothetical protein
MSQVLKSVSNYESAQKILENCYARDSSASWNTNNVNGGILSATVTENRDENGEKLSDDYLVTIQSSYLSLASIEGLFEC